MQNDRKPWSSSLYAIKEKIRNFFDRNVSHRTDSSVKDETYRKSPNEKLKMY